jgi:hypothetical protein
MSNPELLQDLVDAIKLAKQLAENSTELQPEAFLEAIEPYSGVIDRLQEKLRVEAAKDPDKLKAELQPKLEELMALHQEVLNYAGGMKDSVGREMEATHKRAHGIKKYVDRLPTRISITGKRRG